MSVHGNINFNFQGGKIRVIKSAAPIAGNVATTIRPDEGKRFIIQSVRLHYTADANAANRIARLTITDGIDILGQLVENTAPIIATETKDVEWFRGESYGENDGVGGNLIMVGVFPDIIFDYPSLLRLVITITNGLAGDTYDYYISVLEVNV